MKVTVEYEEWYPVRELNRAIDYWPENEIEVTPEFLARYEAALVEFRAVQMVIKELKGEKD